MTEIGPLDKLGRWFDRPGFVWFQLGLIFICLFGNFTYLPKADPDIFARVAVGRLIERDGAVPKVDPFAYTETKAVWYDHEWLSGYVFFVVSQFGGDLSLFFLKSLVCLLTLYFLARAQRPDREYSMSDWVWFVLLICGCAQVWNNDVRSRVFTYLFLSLFFLVMKRFRDHGQSGLIVLLPVIILVWCNMHGGFVVGLALLGAFGMSLLISRSRAGLTVSLVLTLCCVVTLINPYGPGYIAYIFEAVMYERVHIPEWAGVEILSLEMAALTFVGAVSVWGWFKDHKRFSPEAVVFLLGSVYFAFQHLRLVPIALMVGIVYWSDAFHIVVNDLKHGCRAIYRATVRALAMGYAVLILLFGGMTGVFFADISGFSFDYDYYPVKAMAWLRDNYRGGNVLIHFNYGSFALWRLYPRFKVSVDGRYEEVYPERTAVAVATALDVDHPGQRAALEKVWPQFIVIPSDSEAFAKRGRFGGEWALIYQDESFGIHALADGIEALENATHSEPAAIWTPMF
jgi:hypothetical protein